MMPGEFEDEGKFRIVFENIRIEVLLHIIQYVFGAPLTRFCPGEEFE